MTTYIYVVKCEGQNVRAFSTDTLARLFLKRRANKIQSWTVEPVELVTSKN